MEFEYKQKVTELFDQLVHINEDSLKMAIDLFAAAIIDDQMIHTFGTGHSHMIGLELFVRAGGLANVNAILDSTVMTAEGARRSAEIERISGFSKVIWDQHKIQKSDVFLVISNSGRNAMPIEMAELARANGNKVIAITSVAQSKKYPTRNSKHRKLYEIADVVLDNAVPPGDGLLEIGNELTGAASTLSGCFLVNLVATEALKIAVEKGAKPGIYFSQNIDGVDNETLYKRYESRVKHL